MTRANLEPTAKAEANGAVKRIELTAPEAVRVNDAMRAVRDAQEKLNTAYAHMLRPVVAAVIKARGESADINWGVETDADGIPVAITEAQVE